MNSGQKFNVAIIDDDTFMHEMIGDYFRTHFSNAQLSNYTTGEEALQADLNLMQLILLDYNLSSKDKDSANGLKVLQQINARYNHIPVIVLSAQENPEIAANTVRLGAWDYIIKNEQSFNRLGMEVGKIMDRAVMINETAARSKLVNMAVIVAALIFGGFLVAKFV